MTQDPSTLEKRIALLEARLLAQQELLEVEVARRIALEGALEVLRAATETDTCPK